VQLELSCHDIEFARVLVSPLEKGYPMTEREFTKLEWPSVIARSLGIKLVPGKKAPFVTRGDTTDAVWFEKVCDVLGLKYPGERTRAMQLLVEHVGQEWDPLTCSSRVTTSKGGGNVRVEAFVRFDRGLRESGILAFRKANRDLLKSGILTVVDDEDEVEAVHSEGRVLYRLHRIRERDPKVKTRKIRQVLRTSGTLLCEACDDDLERAYGPLGAGLLECHHLKPLHNAAEVETRVNDVALLCPTCHRFAHRVTPWPSVNELRARVASARERGAGRPGSR